VQDAKGVDDLVLNNVAIRERPGGLRRVGMSGHTLCPYSKEEEVGGSENERDNQARYWKLLARVCQTKARITFL
jgi:hypothetical protein